MAKSRIKDCTWPSLPLIRAIRTTTTSITSKIVTMIRLGETSFVWYIQWRSKWLGHFKALIKIVKASRGTKTPPGLGFHSGDLEAARESGLKCCRRIIFSHDLSHVVHILLGVAPKGILRKRSRSLIDCLSVCIILIGPSVESLLRVVYCRRVYLK